MHCTKVTYHVTLLGKESIMQALCRHPLVWQSDTRLLALSKVVSGIDILCQSKVSHLQVTLIVQPI